MPEAGSARFGHGAAVGEPGAVGRCRCVAEWGGVFGDAVVATAILDQLLHHSHVVTIRGDSDRLKAKRKSGLLRDTTAFASAT
jgi:hypothetical protein